MRPPCRRRHGRGQRWGRGLWHDELQQQHVEQRYDVQQRFEHWHDVQQ